MLKEQVLLIIMAMIFFYIFFSNFLELFNSLIKQNFHNIFFLIKLFNIEI